MSRLPGYCRVKGCERPRVGSLKVCESHRKLSADEKKLKIEKPLTGLRRSGKPKPVSEKRKGQLDEYNAKVKKWKEGKTCVMCDWEGLKKPCEHAHHPAGREGERLLNFAELVPLCAKHHIWVTEHSKEAIELGVSLPRNH